MAAVPKQMRFFLSLAFFGLVLPSFSQSNKVDILLLASDHFEQLYKPGNPNTDVLLPKQQKDLKEFSSRVMRYKPDMIAVEVLPERQKEIDSLYSLYLQDKIKLEQLPDGRSEVYQLAFKMGRQLQLSRIECVNAPGGTSQSILDNGKNISLYKEEGLALRALVTEKVSALQKGSLSFNDYLNFLNRPEVYNKVYHLRYITPSRVTNGTFRNPDAMVDTAFINPKYIGAELTSIYKNRDYKIYSNIVTAVMRTKAKKVLLIIGGAHIGSLRSILRDDPEYSISEAGRYLKK